MAPKFTLLLVATGSFAVGMATDRLFRSEPGNSIPQEDQDSSLSIRKSRGHRGTGSRRDQDPGQRKSETRPGEQGDSLPESVQSIIENLNRGRPVEFATAARTILDLPPGQQRRQAIHRLASHWGRSNPEAALRWTESLTGRDRFEAMENILREWSDRDPGAAVAYASQLPGSERTMHLVHDLSRRWAEEDRPAALEWSAALNDPALRARALRGALSSWAEDDPAEAANYTLTELTDRNVRHHVLEGVARRWAERDLEQALQWARQLPKNDFSRATRSVLRSIAEHDPHSAAAMFQQIADDLPAAGPIGREYRHMAEEVASIWSSSNPAEAAEWALTLPERGSIRHGAIGDVAERWMRLDGTAAREWINGLPADRNRDGATERVVHMTMGTDPAEAFAWAQSMTDQDHRRGLMHHTLTRWREVDLPAARQALSGADLSPEVKQRFGEELGLAPSPAPNPPATNGDR